MKQLYGEDVSTLSALPRAHKIHGLVAFFFAGDGQHDDKGHFELNTVNDRYLKLYGVT